MAYLCPKDGNGRLPFLLVALAVLVLGAGPARAEDDALPGGDGQIAALIAEHQAALREHLRANQVDLVLADIERAVELYRMATAAGDEAQQEEACRLLVQTVGRLTSARDASVRKAALEALGRMPDPHCVQYLSRFLRPVTDRDVCPLTMAALEAAGRLADDRFVPRLLNVFKRSTNPTIAAEAMRALGNYGESAEYRTRILRVLIEVVEEAAYENQRRSSEPGGRTATALSDPQGPAARWAALGAALPPSLNQLTGRKLHSPYEWFDLFEANEDDPESLFLDR